MRNALHHVPPPYLSSHRFIALADSTPIQCTGADARSPTSASDTVSGANKSIKSYTLEVAISVMQYYLPFNMVLEKDSCGEIVSVTIINKDGNRLEGISRQS